MNPTQPPGLGFSQDMAYPATGTQHTPPPPPTTTSTSGTCGTHPASRDLAGSETSALAMANHRI